MPGYFFMQTPFYHFFAQLGYSGDIGGKSIASENYSFGVIIID
jgi:hypothetical protein